jgi:hypothetical protein
MPANRSVFKPVLVRRAGASGLKTALWKPGAGAARSGLGLVIVLGLDHEPDTEFGLDLIQSPQSIPGMASVRCSSQALPPREVRRRQTSTLIEILTTSKMNMPVQFAELARQITRAGLGCNESCAMRRRVGGIREIG